jgi:signal transduction histidine kinase
MVLSGVEIIRETGKITRETERIKDDFSYQIDIDGKSMGEFVILSKALNNMAGKINYHVKNLESIVKERTSELHETNERLMTEVSDRKLAERELQKAQDELEQRVEARTRELLAANDILKLEIEERKRAEKEKGKLQAQLQHYQRMESIGTIASGMAHNFRNILAGISANSQLLQMKYKNDKKVISIAESINSSVERGSRLIQGLMQFSRKEGTDALKTLNLVDVIREVDNLISKSFDKRIDIRIDVPEALYIIGDQVGLIQILMNLCTNARDAMPEGGILEIEAKMERDKAVIVVSDNGHGMDKETQEKCFYPFFTTKDVSKGTGLGLSTTYGLIREHHGDVRVYSDPEKGTTFKLSFPLALSEDRGTGEPISQPVKGAGQKILIVDDEKEVTAPLEEILKGLGYNTKAVDNGIAAIDKYEDWQPDAVLLDRSMPHMDGITCAEKIRDLDANARIILISGYEEKGVNGIDKGTRSFIKGYLTKPVDVVALTRLLGAFFG